MALRKRPDVQLQVVVGSAAHFDGIISYLRDASVHSLRHALPWYVRARLLKIFGGTAAVLRREKLSRTIMDDGFSIDARLPLLLEGGTPREMVISNSRGLRSLVDIFARLKPDIVLINGDRFEIFSVAVAAVLLNIRLAHIEGGDVSGTIDNSIRHAVSKLAHLHFPATDESAQRLVRMGEDPATVFTFGSPIIDALRGIDTSLDNSFYERHPHDVGRIDLTKPFLLVAHHPVTTEYDDNRRQMGEILAALDMLKLPQFFIAPNIDAGSDGISAMMREYRAGEGASRGVFHKHLSLEDYTKLLAHAAVAVGNSSSFIREAAYLGTPAVVVGTRQSHRERGANVIEVACSKGEIADAIRRQLEHGTYPRDERFGAGNSAAQIARTLIEIDLSQVLVQKFFNE